MWQAFRKSCASDEMYFATLLCCCGILPDRNEVRKMEDAKSASNGSSSAATVGKEVDSNDGEIMSEKTKVEHGGVVMRKLTFVEWIYPDLDDYSGKSSLADRPVTYKILTRDLVEKVRAEGCIFVRKFKGVATLSGWEDLVLKE